MSDPALLSPLRVRLQKLAIEGARSFHDEIFRDRRLREEIYDGHNGDFPTCPHPDCALVRQPLAALLVSPASERLALARTAWEHAKRVTAGPDVVLSRHEARRIDDLFALLVSSSPEPQEICICAAVQFADGRIVRGHRHDACFRTAEGWTPKPDGKGHVQGFVTSRNRFVGRQEGMRLMAATDLHSAHTGLAFAGRRHDDELFSEDLYFDAHDHVAWNTPYKEPDPALSASSERETPER